MLDFSNKTVHFIGIGGISCHALAKFVLDFGGKVSGSDAKITPICDELRAKGAKIWQGEAPQNIDADIVVFSSAIRADNKELVFAKQSGAKLYERHEFLGEVSRLFGRSVAIAGTHGKTSTTAMVTHILKKSNLKFLSMIGGECVDGGNYVNNTYADRITDLKNCVFVTEACEYKRHMLAVKRDIGVVTNVECDHPDCYKNLDEIQDAFKSFLNGTPIKIASEKDISDLYKTPTNSSWFCVVCKQDTIYAKVGDDGARIYQNGTYVARLKLEDNGEYNYKNALFALTVAYRLGVRVKDGADMLASYKGVKRRFERGTDIDDTRVYFDFAHHPREIKCVLERARKYGSAIVVFQPHTYSRTKAYLSDFASVLGGCDYAKYIVIMPTYPARETLSMGVDSDILKDAIFDKFPQKQVYLAKDDQSTVDFVKSHANEVDTVLMIGAGDIYDLKATLAKR